MRNPYNPFKENRAEQMSDLWKYYVPIPGMDGTGKPIVVEGGRGSGKTMFFQCNSWRQLLSKIKKNGQPSNKLFEERDFVGIYYRVDTTFVSSMESREIKNWGSIFETYFSICILKEVIDMLEKLKEDMLISEIKLHDFIRKFSKRFNNNSNVYKLTDFRDEIDKYLDSIEDIINDSREAGRELRFVTAHRMISDICESCCDLLGRKIVFKIFIDEYETLQEYQQKIINTLIKHSSQLVVFNIGLRPDGMKTRETISKTETIEAPHDYEQLTLNIDDKTYLAVLKEICKKRIIAGKEQGFIPETASEDIEFYLGNYSIDYEIERFESSKITPTYKSNLRKKIKELAIKEKIDDASIKEYIKVLCDEAPIINSRLHYALLCHKTAHTPSIEALYSEYIEQSKRYKDWMHNRKVGLVFLLCKDFKKQKLYYGFDVFAILSSNIVRYFLELCEQIFQIEFLDDYKWDRPISPDKQTETAKYVSEYKVTDIAGYEPYGKELRIFIQYLGQIFYKLHECFAWRVFRCNNL